MGLFKPVRVMLLGAASLSAMSAAHASNITVTSGTITSIASTSNSQTITQTSARAVLNWSDLSVASGNTLTFVQPDKNAVTLNRVVGLPNGGAITPTQIDGTIAANGQVWILNPTGILIGSTGSVNVGGFLATTMNITDQAFDAATNDFAFSGTSSASVVNNGTITAASNGYAVLAGDNVENAGLIQANLGTVALGSGRALTLSFSGDRLISFVIPDAASNASVGVKNLGGGQLIANGGRVFMTARVAGNAAATAINTSGLVQARSASVQNGQIVLDAGPTGYATVSGVLDASGVATGETGGEIKVTGQRIYVNSGASVLAKGHSGGGLITIGQGPAAGAQTAVNAVTTSSPTAIYALSGSKFDASAVQSGAGGSITLLSDYNDTASYIAASGDFFADGGSSGGQGGTISAFFSTIDLTGSNSSLSTRPGEAAALVFNSNSLEIGSVSGGYGRLAQSDIESILNAGRSLTLNAIGSGATAGSILITTSLSKTASANSTLTFAAKNSIVQGASAFIGSYSGVDAFNLNFKSDTDNDGVGVIQLSREIFGMPGTPIRQGGVASNMSFTGKVVLMADVSLSTPGDIIFNGKIDSQAGGNSIYALTANAGTGAIKVQDAIGSSTALSGLTATAGSFEATTISLTGTATANSGVASITSSGLSKITGSLTAPKLVKLGTGALELYGLNTLTDVSVEAGSLRALHASGNGLLSATSLSLVNGGTLDLSQAQTPASTSIKSVSGTGSINLGSSNRIELVSARSQDVFSGTITGGPESEVAITGGTVNISSDLDFNGSIRVGTAALKLLGSASLADASGLSLFSQTGSSLDISGLTTSSTVIPNFFTDPIVLYSNVFLGGKSLAINISNGKVGANAATFSGAGGSLEKTGAGTLRLSGNNSYSGLTRISEGVLQVSTETQLGTGGITMAGGTLRFTSGGTVTLTKPVTLVADSAIEFISDAKAFQVTWSGLPFQNGASAVGEFDIDASRLPAIGSTNTSNVVGDRFSIRNLTVQGASGGNGSFAQSDFSNYYLSAVGPLNYDQNLIGQSMSNGFLFGYNGGSATNGYGGPSGDFNIFSNNQTAPTGTFYFVLTTSGGDRMAVTSIIPIAPLPSNARIDAAINGGFGLRVFANGNLEIAGSVGATQPLLKFVASANGILKLGANAQISTVGNISLGTLTRFINQSASASILLSSSGNWRVYSENPHPFDTTTGDLIGPLNYQFRAYNFNPANSGNTLHSFVAAGQNGLVYRIAPQLSVSSSGAVTKVYDGGTGFTGVLPTLSLSGAIHGDSVALVGTPTGQFGAVNAGATSFALSGLTVSALDSEGKPVYGYSFAPSPSISGLITKRALTASLAETVSRVYDGTTIATLAPGNYVLGGLVAGDVITIQQTQGTYASKDVGQAILVTTALSSSDFVASSGTFLSNYLLPTTASGNIGAITPKLLSGTLTGSISRGYDGTRSATLGSSNFILSGFLGNDGLTVNKSQGLFASPNVGTSLLVTADLTPADVTPLSGTILGNYELPKTVSGAIGTITPKALTIALAGSVSRVYDGTTAASLASSNYVVGGLVSGDAISIEQSQGIYASKDVGKAILVTAILGASNYVAGNGTFTTNYELPTSASGSIGTITPATLTYLADSKQRPANTSNGIFTGKVSGFINGETLENSTTGNLTFTTDATKNSSEGTYSIIGSGLSALNYIFVQSDANSTALLITAPLPNVTQLVTQNVISTTISSVAASVVNVPVATPVSAPITNSVLSSTPATAPGSVPAQAPAPPPTEPAKISNPAPASSEKANDKGSDQPPPAVTSSAPLKGVDAPAPSPSPAPPPVGSGPGPAGPEAPPTPPALGASAPEASPPPPAVTIVAVAAQSVEALPSSPVPDTPPPTPADADDSGDPVLQSISEAPTPSPPPARRSRAIFNQLSPQVALAVDMPSKLAGAGGIDLRYSLQGNPEGF